MIRFKVLKSKASSIENLVQTNERIIGDYFDAHGSSLPPRGIYDRIMNEVERVLIKRTLEATSWNQLKAADLLGINRNTLRKKIRELEIEAE